MVETVDVYSDPSLQGALQELKGRIALIGLKYDDSAIVGIRQDNKTLVYLLWHWIEKMIPAALVDPKEEVLETIDGMCRVKEKEYLIKWIEPNIRFETQTDDNGRIKLLARMSYQKENFAVSMPFLIISV